MSCRRVVGYTFFEQTGILTDQLFAFRGGLPFVADRRGSPEINSVPWFYVAQCCGPFGAFFNSLASVWAFPERVLPCGRTPSALDQRLEFHRCFSVLEHCPSGSRENGRWLRLRGVGVRTKRKQFQSAPTLDVWYRVHTLCCIHPVASSAAVVAFWSATARDLGQVTGPSHACVAIPCTLAAAMIWAIGATVT